jgi:hypothetical protein
MYGELIYRDLPRSETQLPARIVRLAESLFARNTGMSGPEIFAFFGRHSDEIGVFRYGSGAPSRSAMFLNFLESFPADIQGSLILELCEYAPSMKTPPSSEEVQRLKNLIGGVPVPETIKANLEKIDSRFVMQAWEKTIERLKDDPEGAVTSARTLVENVCLHILATLRKPGPAYGDLPALYKAVADALCLAPEKDDEPALRQVLGSCSGLIQGIATLRNQFGDAHGRLGSDIQRRFAHLAANAAGTVSIFLIESLESRGRE